MDHNTLAEFRPKVKVGHAEVLGNDHFYVLQSGAKIKVPALFVDFFTLAQGKNTIQEIFNSFYQRHQHVPFRGFLSFMFDMAKKNVLENSKELLNFQKKKSPVETFKSLMLFCTFIEILVMVGMPNFRTAMITPVALTLSTYFLFETWAFSYFNFFVLFPVMFCLTPKTMIWGGPWLAFHGVIWFIKKNSKKPKANREVKSFIETISSLPLFSSMNNSEINKILRTSKNTFLPQGAYITKKGELAQKVYVLLEGQAEVLTPGNKIQLIAPCVFGESALQSESVRQADIRALTPIQLLQIDAKEFPQVDNPESRELEIAVKQFFKSSPVFSYFGESVSSAFLMYGRILYLGPGQMIFEEGAEGDSLYLLLRGSVEIQMQQKTLKTLKQGDLFGEISLMAHTPRTASVISKENALLLEIPSAAFWEILTQNLDLALLLESIGAKRYNEGQEFKLQIKNAS